MKKTSGTRPDPLLGLLFVATMLAVILSEWIGHPWFSVASGLLVLATLAVATPRLALSRQAFVAGGLVLALAAIVLRDDWPSILALGLERSAFIAAFFVALASLRDPSAASPAIERCGVFLTEQPPGRRYLALTIGGHLFALILNYGAITLLGGLTESVARKESNAEIRGIRNRRMLLAIQRGFVSSLCWSPLGFSMAISTTVISGASWSGAVGFALASAAILMGTGWALDTLLKPKLTSPRPPRTVPTGSWRDLRPLLILLILLAAVVGVLEVLTGLRIIAIVMLVIPILSVVWLALQGHDRSGGAARYVAARGHDYVFVDLPSYASEIVLLVMAGFIGAVGAELIAPLVEGGGIDPVAIPGTLMLVAIVWLIPFAGQFGMNPILAVSLFAPFLSGAAFDGVSPDAVVVAVTAGWALAGATSPFTATVLLVARLGGIAPYQVGWRWNGAFILAGGLALSLWVALVAHL